jgi:ribonuclease G
MQEELLINVHEFETRVALLQNNVLAELHLQRSGEYSLTGNIYKGRVQRILPGMQAAFVDLGLARPGFLHARDIDAPRMTPEGEIAEQPDICDLLHDGQTLLVQIAKDPIATKGARLTTNLALASRYLVMLPRNDHVGISQRIEDEDERERLRDLTAAVRAANPTAEGCGFIVRTAAEGVGDRHLESDMRVLLRIWSRVAERVGDARPGDVVYEELPVHTRVIRDLASADLEAVRIDDLDTFERVREFVVRFLPEFESRVSRYQEPVPLFERFGVEDELSRALEKRVELRCGGHLIIEQTEAMITIDVNTGGFVGARSLEETVYRTNVEAAAVIPRQLRLRNLGGIIVIDFIDMEDEEHQRQVLRALEKAAEADPARTRIGGFSGLGLVEMSRKRTRESLVQQMCEPCGSCGGRGLLKTEQTVCFEVFRAIMRDARTHCPELPPGTEPVRGAGEYLVRGSQNVVDRLLDEESDGVAWLADQIGRAVRFQVEPSYGLEQFDVALLQGVPRP